MKMDKDSVSHEILNILDRLRIMHDLLAHQNYQTIQKEEIKEDLQENLERLKTQFEKLTQY